ncbi:MAG: hypothetical protein IT449_09145 [Phycisphaerales bacterium]|nr:hypothetical protein [Phycisphaerales bacterium]
MAAVKSLLKRSPKPARNKSASKKNGPRKPAAGKQKPAVRALGGAALLSAVRRMSEPSGTARFQAGKALSVTAAKDPRRVYPHFDAIAELMQSDCKLVRWNAMQILTRLAAADEDHKLDAIVGELLAMIRGENLISAANAIRALGSIALHRPDLHDRIIRGILPVEVATYETPECRNVAIGGALNVLKDLGASAMQRDDVAAFVRRQCDNTRGAVARRAQGMMKEPGSRAG